MTELYALGLVDMQKESYYENSSIKIELRNQYSWCLSRGFCISDKGFF